MSRRLNSRGRIARAALLPWLVTAGAAALFVAAPEQSSPPPETSAATSAELRSLRLTVSTLSSQNAALRRELDRMLGGASPTTPASSGARDAPDAVVGSNDTGALADQVREALALARRGDAGADPTAMLQEVVRASPAGLAALQNAYVESAADPDARLLLMPAILSQGGDEAREFLLEQIRAESDPELRRALLEQAAGFAIPIHAGEMKDAFLNVAGDADEETRRAALRGLRFAGGEDVEAALLDATADPAEEVRLAAIESLAGRPEFEDELERLLAEERSPHVRELGRCRLVLNRPTLRRSADLNDGTDR